MLHYQTCTHNPQADWITFIHGAGGSSSIWFKQIRVFKAKYNGLLLDLRGHGKSKNHIGKALKRYNFQSIGDEVVEVLNHLKVTKTHFVGISLGTIIVREITERYPKLTKSMILGGAIMQMNVKGQLLMRTGNMLKSILPYLILYKILAFVVMPKKHHKESRLLFINEAKKLYQKEFIRWFALASTINPLLKFFRIHDSGVPTLYIMGEEDHMFLPSISKLVTDHASSQLFIIPGCGHVVNVDEPLIFNQESLRFLGSI